MLIFYISRFLFNITSIIFDGDVRRRCDVGVGVVVVVGFFLFILFVRFNNVLKTNFS